MAPGCAELVSSSAGYPSPLRSVSSFCAEASPAQDVCPGSGLHDDLASLDQPSWTLPLVFNQVALPVSAGRITISDPRTQGGSVNCHTTYLVSATLGSRKFESRKRYKDFEWLRNALVRHYPGIPIPHLPRKKKTGRFDDVFIEERRSGLEEFCKRLFLRPAFVQNLLLTFLETQEDQVDSMKKIFDHRNVDDMWNDYQAAFAKDLVSVGLPDHPDDTLGECKAFLEKRLPVLKENINGFSKMAELQREQKKQMGLFQRRLADFSKKDPPLSNVGVTRKLEMEFSQAIKTQNQFRNNGPELLLATAQREEEDFEAMQEALTSIAHLRKQLQDLRAKVKADEHKQDYLSEKVHKKHQQDERGAKHHSWREKFGRKDKDTQLAEINDSLRASRHLLDQAKAFHAAAENMFIFHEVGKFHAEVAAIHRWSAEAFAQRQIEFAQASSSIWKGVRTKLPYVARVAGS